MANRWGNNGNSDRLSFLELQNHWRWWLWPWNLKTLAPWKKSFDKPNNVLKSRNITLPTEVCLVNEMVFPLVMYGCQSRTTKKVARRRTDAFARRSNHSILKEISPEYILEGLMLKLQYFGYLMWRVDIRIDPEAGTIECRMRRGGQDEMVGWHIWLNGHEFEQAPGDFEGQKILACCSPWGRKESYTTEWLNWTNRASPFLDAKTIVNMISVSTIWNDGLHMMSMCRVISVLSEEGVFYDQCVLLAKFC